MRVHRTALIGGTAAPLEWPRRLARTSHPKIQILHELTPDAAATTAEVSEIGGPRRVLIRSPTYVLRAVVGLALANRVTPAKVGGMAANVRFLQKKGMKLAVAVSAVGLNTVAGFVTHVAMLAAALTLAGQERQVDLPLPAPRTALLVGVVLLAASAVAVATRAGRKLLTRNLLPALRAAASSLVTIARTPLKLAELRRVRLRDARGTHTAQTLRADNRHRPGRRRRRRLPRPCTRSGRGRDQPGRNPDPAGDLAVVSADLTLAVRGQPSVDEPAD